MVRHPSPNAAPSQRPARMRTYATVVQVTANLSGAFLCMFYFLFLDPPDLAFRVDDGELWFALAMTAGLLVLGTGLGFRYQRDLTRDYSDLWRGQSLDGPRLERARRRALNAPLVFSLISATNWVLAAAIMGLYRLFLTGQPTSASAFEAFRVALGVLVSGLVTASIVFFAMDSFWRRVRPVFFPEGGLVRIRGVFRLRVRTRLFYTFMLVSVVPMVVVGVILHHKITTALKTGAVMTAAHQAALSSTLFVLFFIPAVLIALSVLLSRMVSTSVADPVRDMERAMARVEDGDLSAQVTVSTNDELGSMGEAFNHMVAGLRERDFIKETFGKYVSREIRDEILAGRIPLDGVIREVTVMFADLRDFTPLVEATPPKEVVRVVNGYFEAMTPAIREHGGLVLQFLGDEIYAVFGAPLGLADHPRRAVAAAMDMRRRLAEVNDDLVRRGIAPLRHGIGIHTGQVLAANIGSPDRLSYLLVGDTVNVASRIQGLTRDFQTDILVSAATQSALDPAMGLRSLPATPVKGKAEPVALFAVD